MKMKTSARACSFCHKSEDVITQLFAAPEDYSPRAFICNECITVCARAVTQETPSMQPVIVSPSESQVNRFLLLVRHWLDQDSKGADTSAILGEIKAMARELILNRQN